MKNKKIVFYGIIFTAVLALVILISTNYKKRNVNSDNPAFAKYITAYTSGVISKNSPIRIQLTGTVLEQIKNADKLPKDLFEFRPKVKGVYSLNNNILEFVPEKNLESGKEYYAEFNLGELIKVEDDLEYFNFEFKTIIQAFDYIIEEQKTIDKKELK